ncbi:MAG: hypothetical protein U1F49_08900 [Rubrivivax sp.]
MSSDVNGPGLVDPPTARIVERLRGEFPLVERPFAAVATELGLTEEALIERVRRMLANGTVLRFGPLFCIQRAGGQALSAALSVPEQRFDEVTSRILAAGEVAHLYRRAHPFNLWLLAATASAAEAEATLDRIERDTGLALLRLPLLRESGGSAVRRSRSGAAVQAAAAGLDTFDRELVAAVQSGLPLVAKPYEALAAMLGTDGRAVCARLRDWLASGLVRRIGAVPNDQHLGFAASPMSAWNVADEAVDACGAALADLPFVAHASLRPRALPGWPYNFVVMLKAAPRADVLCQHEAIGAQFEAGGARSASGALIEVTAVLKKTGLRIRES